MKGWKVQAGLPDGTAISTMRILQEETKASPFGVSFILPALWETMVLDPQGEVLEIRSYYTEKEAHAGHAQAVAAWTKLRGGG